MEHLLMRVRWLVKEAFPRPATVRLQDEDGIIGVVVSSAFKGLEAVDRRNLIWQALERGLNAEERQRVVIIVAITPEEDVAHTS